MYSKYHRRKNESYKKKTESLLNDITGLSDKLQISKLVTNSLFFYLSNKYGQFNPYAKILVGSPSRSTYRGFDINETGENNNVVEEIIKKLDNTFGHEFSVKDSFYGSMLLDNRKGFLQLSKLKEEWIEYAEVRELFLNSSKKEKAILQKLVTDEMADVTCCVLKLLSYSSTFQQIGTLLYKNSRKFKGLDDCLSFDEVVGQLLDIHCRYHKKQPLDILNDYLASLYRELDFLDIRTNLDTILLQAYVKRRSRYQFGKTRTESVKIIVSKREG